jgi:molybdopterin synthase catalytic subunit
VCRLQFQLDDQVIDPAQLLEFVRGPDCGATAMFVGTVRRWTGSRETAWLDYECYPEMVEREMQRIAGEAADKFGCVALAFRHRIGQADPGATSIALAVATPHRAAAFAAVEWAVDQVKHRLPIWKRDVGTDGSCIWQATVTTRASAIPVAEAR